MFIETHNPDKSFDWIAQADWTPILALLVLIVILVIAIFVLTRCYNFQLKQPRSHTHRPTLISTWRRVSLCGCAVIIGLTLFGIIAEHYNAHCKEDDSIVEQIKQGYDIDLDYNSATAIIEAVSSEGKVKDVKSNQQKDPQMEPVYLRTVWDTDENGRTHARPYYFRVLHRSSDGAQIELYAPSADGKELTVIEPTIDTAQTSQDEQ